MAGPAPAAIWQELNPRQQIYLSTIFDADQAKEEQRAADSAAGHWDNTPAAVWRLIDAYHEPSAPALVGYTSLQYQWRDVGVHDQGTGATMAVLHERGLITFGTRPTRFGQMRQVAITSLGRKVVRASRGGKRRPARCGLRRDCCGSGRWRCCSSSPRRARAGAATWTGATAAPSRTS
ncbi:hypothetical protein ACFQ0M_47660 [Kitasatospora aburaviensis]